ncbi:restriction endonuclease [Peribacillus psychrosaccharolyticus]
MNGLSLGIQVKCYSNTVSNKAVVAAGEAHYKLVKAIVLTNNYFTDSARELSTSNGVVLWGRNILKDKIRDFFNE